MAKATLEFDLNDPDDVQAHLRAIKALDMALVLWQLALNTKKNVYNEIEFKNINAYEAVDLVFERLQEEMDDYGINIDQLIV